MSVRHFVLLTCAVRGADFLMQRYCQRAERKLVFNFPSAAISYAKIKIKNDSYANNCHVMFSLLSKKAFCVGRSDGDEACIGLCLY